MKIMMLLLMCAPIVACVDQPTTSTDEQGLCTEDNPGCDTGWFRQWSVGQTYGAANANGYTITATSVASCDATHCYVTASLGGLSQLRTDCYDFVGVEWCDFVECDGVNAGGYISWTCHDLPPL